jgi:hypothetical protein
VQEQVRASPCKQGLAYQRITPRCVTDYRWPVGNKEWKERTKRIHKPILLKTLGM